MKKLIPYIALILVSILYLNSCRNSSEKINNLSHNLEVQRDSIGYYRNSLKQEVAEKQSYIGSEKELNKYIDKIETKNSQLKASLKHWKSIKSAVKIETKTVIKEVKIPFESPIDYSFERYFDQNTKFYRVNGTVTNLGLFIDKFEVFNIQTVVFGRKKLNWFKTEIKAEVTNSNPLIKTTGLESYIFTEKQKRWNVSVFGGYSLLPKQTPVIGIGVGYSLFNF